MLRLAPLSRAIFLGALAGLVVGFLDGLRSAAPFAAGPLGSLPTLALAMGVDGCLGGLGGAVLGSWNLVRRWGGQQPGSGVLRAVAYLLAGTLAAALGLVATLATARRVNRFLAAGVVVAALLLGWALSAAVGPALSRLLARKRAAAASAPITTLVGRWVSGPALTALCAVAAFVIVWRTRAPLRGAALVERAAWVASIGAVAPWWVSVAARWPPWPRVPAVVVRGLALLLALAGAATLMWLRWEQDLQYLPWADVLVGSFILALGLGLAASGFVRRRWHRPWGPALALGLVSFGLAVGAASSELARKQLAARGGLVGPALTMAMRALDADGDGYARWLGGGDCNDADPDVNPGALDWPGDELDQDCDGHDARWSALSSPAFHPVPSSVPEHLNVLLIAIDTLRADRLGAYGYHRSTSPHIDAVAKEGVVFENGWAHAPSTRYSMPAMFTGRWPSAITWEGGGYCHECRSWWPRFAPSNRTIGEALKNAGYFTGSLWAYGYFDADERRGFERGIDVYDSRRGALHTNVAGPAESIGSSAREITDDALAFLQQHGHERFFLTVHHYDPHLSYERHAEAPDFGSRPSDLYDGEVWFTDLQLGRLFDQLKAQGLWDKTAIVITGDHGEGFGERGVVAHGYHLYPAQTKVPFIVRVPGLPPRRVATPVSHVDLAPSLANLARAPHEPSFLGRSFVDLLQGQVNAAVPLAPVFQEVSYEGDNKKRGIVTETHQLIWNWTPHNTTECYALGKPNAPDIWGTPAGADVCPSLKAQLRRWLAALALPADVQEKMANSVFGGERAAPVPGLGFSARLGQAVEVLGADLPEAPVSRGQNVSVGVHFRVRAPVPEGWRLFFHLNGPAGAFVNLDHVPVEGAYPLERWRVGQTIVDRHGFAIPATLPPGSYTLSLGLWRGAERMPIEPAERADGDNRLRVATIEVR